MRINARIDTPKVRLIGEEGEQHGIVRIEDALRLAEEKELDLVEVAPHAKPVVCKLMDYGRQCYQEKKKRNEARGKQRHMATKMVKFRPNTFKGDHEVKSNKIRRFLEQGDKVKVVMQFRGRELIHSEKGYRTFRALAEKLADHCSIDLPPTMEGRLINMVLVPVPARLRKQRPEPATQAAGGKDAANANGATDINGEAISD